MLEHAEVSISEINNLQNSPIIKKMDKRSREIRYIIKILNTYWSKSDLPKNLVRLAENIYQLLNQLKLQVYDLQLLLTPVLSEDNKVLTKNLSPYFTILQLIIDQKPNSISTFLNSKSKKKIVIPPEIDFQNSSNSTKIIRI